MHCCTARQPSPTYSPPHENNNNPDLIRAALQHIPATLPCDEWARVGRPSRANSRRNRSRDLHRLERHGGRL